MMTVSPLIKFMNRLVEFFVLNTVATAGLQQSAYTVREEDGIQRVCIFMTGMREIDLSLILSTIPQTASGEH